MGTVRSSHRSLLRVTYLSNTVGSALGFIVQHILGTYGLQAFLLLWAHQRVRLLPLRYSTHCKLHCPSSIATRKDSYSAKKVFNCATSIVPDSSDFRTSVVLKFWITLCQTGDCRNWECLPPFASYRKEAREILRGLSSTSIRTSIVSLHPRTAVSAVQKRVVKVKHRVRTPRG